jgi:hypothetical protein
MAGSNSREEISMKLALKVRVNGQTEVMDISGDTLSALQSAVGGLVEVVNMKWGVNVWMDEEGKLKNYRVNKFGTMLYWETYAITSDDYDYGRDLIVGDIVLTGKDDEDGNVLSLTDAEIEHWTKYIDRYFTKLKLLPSPK